MRIYICFTVLNSKENRILGPYGALFLGPRAVGQNEDTYVAGDIPIYVVRDDWWSWPGYKYRQQKNGKEPNELGPFCQKHSEVIIYVYFGSNL